MGRDVIHLQVETGFRLRRFWFFLLGGTRRLERRRKPVCQFKISYRAAAQKTALHFREPDLLTIGREIRREASVLKSELVIVPAKVFQHQFSLGREILRRPVSPPIKLE